MPMIDGKYEGGGNMRGMAHSKMRKAMAATEANAGAEGAEEHGGNPSEHKQSFSVHEKKEGGYETRHTNHETGEKSEPMHHDAMADVHKHMDKAMGTGGSGEEEKPEHGDGKEEGSSLGINMSDEANEE